MACLVSDLRTFLRPRILNRWILTPSRRTCAIGIYRQTRIPGLDFNEMPYQGIGATAFSGLEPPVAISLSCVPFLRPLYQGKLGTSHDRSNYGVSGGSNAARSKSMQNSRPFTELEDSSSELELQPQVKTHDVKAEPVSSHGRGNNKPGHITMTREWAVESGYRN